MLTPRYRQAIQATTLNGQIVCADATARANGCQPINVFGGETPSDAALAYIEPGDGPFQHTRQKQDAASISINGEPFSLWAGPVSVAFGGEWRREFYHVVADPYGNGVSAESPNSATYPVDPVLSAAGNNWYAGNYHDGRGQFNVKEAFLEVNMPFLDSVALGKANLNAAGRWTHYSTAGTVYTWKVGGTWETPIDGIRLRAVTSRDVRAPNLSELFAAPVTTTIPNFTNPFTNSALLVIQNVVGNPALKPEVARNTEAGIVLARPHWLPGLSLSADYYHIKINGVISSLSAQQQVNFCFTGLTQYCSTFNFAPTNGTAFVNVQVFNLASIKTSGFDFEGSYQFKLENILPGRFTIRGLATNVRHYITDPGIANAAIIDTAGQNSGNTPKWKVLGIESWDGDKVSLSIQQRWISDGTFGNQYVVCSAGTCPIRDATTANNFPTIDYNHMKGALYWDIGGSYKLTSKLTAYFKIDNLFNRDPTPSPQTNTGLDANPALYDLLGRFYRAGIRYNF
jgi:outer membrane receptor protein involved in Fe transport